MKKGLSILCLAGALFGTWGLSSCDHHKDLAPGTKISLTTFNYADFLSVEATPEYYEKDDDTGFTGLTVQVDVYGHDKILYVNCELNVKFSIKLMDSNGDFYNTVILNKSVSLDKNGSGRVSASLKRSFESYQSETLEVTDAKGQAIKKGESN